MSLSIIDIAYTPSGWEVINRVSAVNRIMQYKYAIKYNKSNEYNSKNILCSLL